MSWGQSLVARLGRGCAVELPWEDAVAGSRRHSVSLVSGVVMVWEGCVSVVENGRFRLEKGG